MAVALPKGYSLQDILEEGDNKNATVVLARDEEQVEVVLKLIDLKQVQGEHKKFLRREVVSLWRLQHHGNIVSFRGFEVTRDHACLIMDYAGPENVKARVMRKGCLEEDSARWLFQQLMTGLDYTHRMGVSNRDISLKNLICDSEAHENPILLLADWGVSKADSSPSKPKSEKGTYHFMAPEVWRNCPQYGMGDHIYDGHKADIFSSGVCLLKMLFGVDAVVESLPALEVNDELESAPKNSIQFPDQRVTTGGDKLEPISEDCKNLLTDVLQNNPNKRLTMDLIWQHPWFIKNLPDGCRPSEEMIENHRRLNSDPEGSQRKQDLIDRVMNL